MDRKIFALAGGSPWRLGAWPAMGVGDIHWLAGDRQLLCAVFLLLYPMALFSQSQGVIAPGTRSRAAMSELWETRVAGTNVALGRPVVFSPTPSYHLTSKGDTDSSDLVDGELSATPNQAIWWDPRAVGWNGNRSRWKTIIVDLGEPKAVSKVVWRVVAGCAKRNFIGPRRVRLSASPDGVTAYEIAERYRWRDDLAGADAYRLPNVGPPDSGDEVYVYPIEIPAADVRTRYVVLEFEMDGTWLASDELAVIAGEPPGRAPDTFPSRVLQTKDVWVRSDESRYPLVAGSPLPLFLRQRDLRSGGEKAAVSYYFQLPAGVGIEGPPYYQRPESEDRTVCFTTPRGGNSRRVGPFYFLGNVDAQVDVRVRAEGAGADPQPWVTIRLYPAELPSPFRLAELSTSIGWMVDHDQMRWPEFETVYARLGFNTIPTFPRGWGHHLVSEGKLSREELRAADAPGTLTAEGNRLGRLRADGYRILYMESPFHVVNWRYPEGAEQYRCQQPSGPPAEASFCPTYRGPYFSREVRRVADAMLMIGGADLLMWDWEIAGSGMWLGKTCRRCQAAFSQTDLDWPIFVKRKTLEMLTALQESVRETAASRDWPVPRFGLYNHDAVETYSGVFDFAEDGILDFQNSSLYVGDDPLAVHKRIRMAAGAAETSPVIPWLTTGTYGYVTPVNARIMVWEAMLNGASGMTYFCFEDMNPAHLLEISRALAALAPIEQLLVEGTPSHDRFHLSDPAIRHSAVCAGGRGALLLVNPSSRDRVVSWRWAGTPHADTVQVKAGDALLERVGDW